MKKRKFIVCFTILFIIISLLALSSCGAVPTDTNALNIPIQPTPSLIESAAETAVIPSPTDAASATALPTETAIITTTTATPIITPIPTENPGPRDIELDFLNDKFDKVEVLVDGSYVDVSGIWKSFKGIIGKPILQEFNYEGMSTLSNIRFTKDGKDFMFGSWIKTNNAYTGSDRCFVMYEWGNYVITTLYKIPNSSLFARIFNVDYLHKDDQNGLVLNEYFSGNVYQMMYDSPVLKYDNAYIWTPKKAVPIFNIAKYMKNSIDVKPDDIGSCTSVRNYTYIYSADISIFMDIYGKDTASKGIYANVRYEDNDIWLLLNCSIQDFDNGLSVDDAYHVPRGAVPVRDDEWFNGYEKIEAVYGDTVVDVTEYWYKYSDCIKICDWETYLNGPAMPVDYEYRMTKNGTVKTMGVSDMYDYFISEGDGLYYCDYLTSYRNAFIMTEEEEVIEGFLNRSIYQKMFKCAVLDISQEYTEHRSILMNQKACQLATSLAYRITERLNGKPDIEIVKRSESTCYYKGEAISVIAWDIPGDGYDAGYVNILSSDTDIWLKIQNIQFLLGFLGVNDW
ncbi:MAG: hypothetical protein WC554_15740 [Clostridia bacterium]|jgi:hypothetical protein